MTEQYNIVGSVLEIINITQELASYFEGFSCEKDDELPDLVVTVKNADDSAVAVEYPTMQHIFGIRYGSLTGRRDKWRHILSLSTGGNEYLLSSEDWSEQLLAMDSSYHKSFFELQPRWTGLIMCGFYLRLLAKRALLLHASAVQYQGRAVIFTGPSGIGKTTQAELWKKYLNAQILNGDKVFLRFMDEKIMAWGSPWSGSSPYRVNDSAEVAAIVVLSQAPNNTFSKLDTFNAIGQFSPNVFLPFWEETMLVSGMGVLDSVITRVPVYHLSARNDEEAVRLVQKEIFGNNKSY